MTETSSKIQYCTEIPADLKTLVSCVSRGFYPYEHAIVMDYLMFYPCLKVGKVERGGLNDELGVCWKVGINKPYYM